MREQRLWNLGDQAGVVPDDLADRVRDVELFDAHVVLEDPDQREQLRLCRGVAFAEHEEEIVARLEQVSALGVQGRVRVHFAFIGARRALGEVALEVQPEKVHHRLVEFAVEHDLLVLADNLREVVRREGDVGSEALQENISLLVCLFAVSGEVLLQRRQNLDGVLGLMVDLDRLGRHQHLDELQVLGDARALRHVPHHQGARLARELGVVESHEVDHRGDDRVGVELARVIRVCPKLRGRDDVVVETAVDARQELVFERSEAVCEVSGVRRHQSEGVRIGGGIDGEGHHEGWLCLHL
mmetsp:Transcript_54978/g.130011  ORF Transcript_54978/g.130011 Transcript_54978/m.130011 type:complete len:298 (-) Transcript_54978:566-1459(-)